MYNITHEYKDTKWAKQLKVSVVVETEVHPDMSNDDTFTNNTNFRSQQPHIEQDVEVTRLLRRYTGAETFQNSLDVQQPRRSENTA